MPLIEAQFSGPLPWGWAETTLMRRPAPVTAAPRESEDPSGVRGSVEEVSKGFSTLRFSGTDHPATGCVAGAAQCRVSNEENCCRAGAEPGHAGQLDTG